MPKKINSTCATDMAPSDAGQAARQ